MVRQFPGSKHIDRAASSDIAGLLEVADADRDMVRASVVGFVLQTFLPVLLFCGSRGESVAHTTRRLQGDSYECCLVLEVFLPVLLSQEPQQSAFVHNCGDAALLPKSSSRV